MRAVRAQPPTGFRASRVNLELLKLKGQAALDCSDIPGLLKVVLREVHVRFENFDCESVALFSHDIFQSHPQDADPDLFPPDSTITRAVFDLYLFDSPIPRPVAIEPPFTIQPAHSSDTEIVLRWAALCGFVTAKESSSLSDEQSVSIA